MTNRLLTLAALLAALLLVSGCATSRSELRVAAPPPITADVADDAPLIRIRSIVDARVFEQDPDLPSTPSLGFGGADAATEEVKTRAIGRKRNGYGMALGDVLLEPGQTVVGLLHDNLAAGLQQAGYRIATGDGTDGIPLDVRMIRFWSWFQPGFWTIKLHSQIATELTVDGGQPMLVEAQVMDARGAATETAWLEIVDMALAAYREKVAGQRLEMPGRQVADRGSRN